MRLWVVDKDKKDLSGGLYIDITSGQKKNIPNVAYENKGKTSVRVAGEVRGTPNAVVIAAKGVWSPDSHR
ncbi:hypothetical protein QFZ25_003812 [Bacillus atrophaeus]|nr:hypothetical protein [Bacillus atrophaeus]